MIANHPCGVSISERGTGNLRDGITDMVLNGQAARAQDIAFQEHSRLHEYLNHRSPNWKMANCTSKIRAIGSKYHILDQGATQHAEINRTHMGVLEDETRMEAMFKLLGANGGVPTIIMLRNNSLDHWLANFAGLPGNCLESRHCNQSDIHARRVIPRNANLGRWIRTREEAHEKIVTMSLRFARQYSVPLLVLWYEDAERHPEIFRELIFPFLGWEDWAGPLTSDQQKRNIETHRSIITNYKQVQDELRATGQLHYLQREELLIEGEPALVRRSGPPSASPREQSRNLVAYVPPPPPTVSRSTVAHPSSQHNTAAAKHSVH
jgi:hypothetical protein